MTLRTSALANNCSKASSRFPTSRATSSFGPAATELRPRTDFGVMAAPFDRCTAYFGAPFHTHTLGCGQTIVVRLAGTLEAGPGIPRSEYMRRRLMSESGHSRLIDMLATPLAMSALLRKRTLVPCRNYTEKPLEIVLPKSQQNAPFWTPNFSG